VKVAEGFFDQLQHVLPFFWNNSLPATKTAVVTQFGAHLQLIGKIADKTVESSITTTDLSRLNRVDILAGSIKLDKATSLSDAQTAVQKRKQATCAILASCGHEMDKYYICPPDSNADDLEIGNESDDEP
jgi:hypothetical protein